MASCLRSSRSHCNGFGRRFFRPALLLHRSTKFDDSATENNKLYKLLLPLPFFLRSSQRYTPLHPSSSPPPKFQLLLQSTPHIPPRVPSQQHRFQTRRTLAGHNKWSKIKREKAVNDKARSTTHTKAAHDIEVASSHCGGDTEDLALNTAISAARAVQLPRERVETAVERGADPSKRGSGGGGGKVERMRYDGTVVTPAAKVSVIVEALTDNRNRTAANVRHSFTKTGGKLLATGSNGWLFDRAGVAIVSLTRKEGEFIDDGGLKDGEEVQTLEEEGNASEMENFLDYLSEYALDLDLDLNVYFGDDGGDDDDDEAVCTVRCDPNDLLPLVRSLLVEGYNVTEFDNRWIIKDEGNTVVLDAESAEKFETFLETMKDDLDVANVYHNAFLSEELS